MSKDFTIITYKQLVESLSQKGYSFQTFREFIQEPCKKVILLRHDVDARKEHSLRFAKIQHELGITGTYYFRMVPQSFDEGVIREIASMGHEIGYHYEDMDFAKGDVDKAYELAKKHLAQLREVAEVKTICMHGSPRSPYDNKEVWKNYDYRELGIIAEPYFDLDFLKVLYLTDTGRRWDGEGVSIRDKAPGVKSQKPEEKGSRDSGFENHVYHSTHDIINACKAGGLPNQIMFNFHPQRWTNNPVTWTQELVWQNVKNMVKRGLVKYRD